MSWLLGRNRQQPTDFSGGADGPDKPEGQTAGERGNDSQLTKAERKAMEAYRFDSSALERAADAAKTLERSSKSLVNIHSFKNFIIGCTHCITDGNVD